jgi:hypothetical protein
MTVERILYHISVFSVLVPLITGIIFYNKLDINSRIVLVLLIFASIPQLGVYLPGKFVFYNIYTIADSAIWGYLFFKNSRNKVIRSTIVIIVFLQAILSIYVFSSSGIETRFFSEFACLNSLLQVLWVLSFVYERYKREEIRVVEKEPMFWFCLGILIYAPATYFRTAFYDDILKTDYAVLIIHHLANAAMYLVFTIGIFTNVIRTLKFRNVFSQNRS